MALVRQRQYSLGQGGVLGLLQSGEAEEGADRGQAGIAGACFISAFVPEMAQESAEEGGIEVCHCELRRRLLQLPPGVFHQQPECIPRAGDGMRACPAMLDQVGGEEHLQ